MEDIKKAIDHFYDLYSPYTDYSERDYSKYNMSCVADDLRKNPDDNPEILLLVEDILKRM